MNRLENPYILWSPLTTTTEEVLEECKSMAESVTGIPTPRRKYIIKCSECGTKFWGTPRSTRCPRCMDKRSHKSPDEQKRLKDSIKRELDRRDSVKRELMLELRYLCNSINKSVTCENWGCCQKREPGTYECYCPSHVCPHHPATDKKQHVALCVYTKKQLLEDMPDIFSGKPKLLLGDVFVVAKITRYNGVNIPVVIKSFDSTIMKRASIIYSKRMLKDNFNKILNESGALPEFSDVKNKILRIMEVDNGDSKDSEDTTSEN